MKTCVEEGALQAYLDGELSPDAAHALAAHLAACTACEERAQEAEAELSFFASVMSPATVSVPTERLRERIDAAIAETRRGEIAASVVVVPESRWRVWLNNLAAALTFTPGTAAAFASLLMAVSLSVFYAARQFSPREVRPDEIAARVVPAVVTNAVPVVAPASNKLPQRSAEGSPSVGGERQPVLNAAVDKPHLRTSGKAVSEPKNRVKDAQTPIFLPGEKTYLTAIASLTSTIESGGPQSLPPTLRAEYERNLAVVNQAIISTRVAARRNPRDTDAQDFLHSAYQNKVELLSAVAEQTQLASVKD